MTFQDLVVRQSTVFRYNLLYYINKYTILVIKLQIGRLGPLIVLAIISYIKAVTIVYKTQLCVLYIYKEGHTLKLITAWVLGNGHENTALESIEILGLDRVVQELLPRRLLPSETFGVYSSRIHIDNTGGGQVVLHEVRRSYGLV